MSDRKALGLGTRIRDTLNRVPLPGTAHVAAWTRQAADARVLVRASEPVPAASTIKVPVLAAALREVASGRRALDERIPVPAQRPGGSGVLQATPGIRDLSLADLLTLMIIVSDNTATNIVIELIGMERINAFCQETGLASTVVRRVMMDLDARSRGIENTTSALDQATLLEALAWGDVLDQDLRDFAIRSLTLQQFNDGLPALLPHDVVVAHKTGELPGVRHDVGILTGAGGRQAVIAVLTSGSTGPDDERAATTLIGALGEAAWLELAGG